MRLLQAIVFGVAMLKCLDASKENIDVAKMMPKPDKLGFKDDGVTKGEQLDQKGQMDRFGIPDLNNPTTRQLTDLDFEIAISGNKYCAILFYSEGQKDYKYYALHWEKAAMDMQESLSIYTSANITMARFDISEPEHADVVFKYSINRDVPVMKLFYGGKLMTNIDVPVSHNDIKQFIISRTLPPASLIETEYDAKKWKRRKQFNQANLKFLAFFDKKKDAEKIEKYKGVANRLRDRIQFGYVTNEDLFKSIATVDSANEGDIVLLRDFDEPRVIPFTGSIEIPEVISFIRSYRIPLLTNLHDTDEFKVRDFLEDGTKYRLITFFENEKAFQDAEKSLKTIAKEVKQEALVGYMVQDPNDPSSFDYTFWGVPGNEPSTLWMYMKRDRKYIYSGKDAHDLTTMRQLIHNATSGILQPKLRSQVPPVKNNGPIRVLVTDTFETDVYGNSEQDSMILFYNPHHKASQWLYQQVERSAKVWRRDSRLLIGSVDVTQNDIAQVETDEFPVLFYLTSSEKAADQKLSTTLDIPFPDTRQLVEFVTNNTRFDLRMDEKVFNRLVEEEEKLKLDHENRLKKRKESTAANKGSKTVEGGNEESASKLQDQGEKKDTKKESDMMFSARFQELKEKVMATEVDQEAKVEVAKTGDEKFVPGSFDELSDAHKMINDELQAMLSKTGFKLPENFEQNLDREKLLDSITWYHSLYFIFNLMITTIFGNGVSGAIAVLVILMTIFFGIPALLKLRRRKAMTLWLTTFYKEHNPNHLNRVDTVVGAYLDLNDGMNKLKEDAIRKYVMKEEKETKKTK